MTKIDWMSVGRGALKAVIGALLTYGTEVLTKTDFGPWTVPVMAFWSTATNAVMKWLGLDDKLKQMMGG